MTRLGRPVQTGWHATVPPLHVNTREQFQIRAASALVGSKLAPSCSGTNPGAILAPESPRVCQQKSTRVVRYVCQTTTGILQTREHGPAPSYECGNAWSLVPATNVGPRSRPWHTSPQLIVPRHMQFSRTPATIGHDGCSPAAMPGRSPGKSTRQV